jgi:hypothetical protein
MTSCQYKQSTEQYALFKNKVDLLNDFSQKLILTVLSNLFRTLRTHCIINQFKYIHFLFYNTKISDNNAESGKVPRMLAAFPR